MTTDELETKIRTFIRDHDGLRVLLEGDESTSDEIGLAIDMGLSDLNSVAPITNTWTIDDYPLSIIMYAAIGELLNSVGLASTANTLPYQDANIGNIDTEAKAQVFLQLGQSYLGYAMDRASKYKASIDIEETLAYSMDEDGNSNVGIPSGQF